MEENSDSEYDCEEAVVLVELNGIIDSNFLLQEQTPTKILGIDSDTPILQLGHYLFSGEYEDNFGTVIAYEPTSTTVNSEGKEIKDYKYLCKTDKKLSMKRIFLQEKETTKTDESKERQHGMLQENLLQNVHESDAQNTEQDDSKMDCSDASTSDP